MVFYKGIETVQRRQELVANVHSLKLWLRIRRDINAAAEDATARFKVSHSQQDDTPPVHMVIPYTKRPDDPATTLTEWTIPIPDLLTVCSRRIHLYRGNLQIVQTPSTSGVEVPEEDSHGMELVRRIQERVNKENAGTYFPLRAEIINTPEFLTREITDINSDPADVLYWTTLWEQYLRTLLLKQVQKRRGDSTVNVWISAPDNIHEYGFQWKRRKKLIFDWQTVKMLETVIEKMEISMRLDNFTEYIRAKDRIKFYYELLHEEEDPPKQPDGLFPTWLYFLPDIIDIGFLPKGK